MLLDLLLAFFLFDDRGRDLAVALQIVDMHVALKLMIFLCCLAPILSWTQQSPTVADCGYSADHTAGAGSSSHPLKPHVQSNNDFKPLTSGIPSAPRVHLFIDEMVGMKMRNPPPGSETDGNKNPYRFSCSLCWAGG